MTTQRQEKADNGPLLTIPEAAQMILEDMKRYNDEPIIADTAKTCIVSLGSLIAYTALRDLHGEEAAAPVLDAANQILEKKRQSTVGHDGFTEEGLPWGNECPSCGRSVGTFLPNGHLLISPEWECGACGDSHRRWYTPKERHDG